MARARLIAVAVAAIAACAPQDEAYSRDAAVLAAKSRFGSVGNISFYEVPSRGVIRDSVILWLSAVGIDSAGERGLVRLLRRSGPGPLKLLVSGPVPAKTYRVLENALERNEGRGLSHVDLLFVAPDEHRGALRGPAEAAGVRLSFVSFAEAAARARGLGEGNPAGVSEGRAEPIPGDESRTVQEPKLAAPKRRAK
jgi:hypothetical protein